VAHTTDAERCFIPLFGSVDPTDGLAGAMALAWGRDEKRRKEAFDLNATKGRKYCEARTFGEK
jgi:hypothetical protein